MESTTHIESLHGNVIGLDNQIHEISILRVCFLNNCPLYPETQCGSAPESWQENNCFPIFFFWLRRRSLPHKRSMDILSYTILLQATTMMPCWINNLLRTTYVRACNSTSTLATKHNVYWQSTGNNFQHNPYGCFDYILVIPGARDCRFESQRKYILDTMTITVNYNQICSAGGGTCKEEEIHVMGIIDVEPVMPSILWNPYSVHRILQIFGLC